MPNRQDQKAGGAYDRDSKQRGPPLNRAGTRILAYFLPTGFRVAIVNATPRLAETIVSEIWGCAALGVSGAQLARPHLPSLAKRQAVPAWLPCPLVISGMRSSDTTPSAYATDGHLDAFRFTMRSILNGSYLPSDSMQVWLPPRFCERSAPGPLPWGLSWLCARTSIGFRLGQISPKLGGSGWDDLWRRMHLTLLDTCVLSQFVAPRLSIADISSIRPGEQAELDSSRIQLPFSDVSGFGQGRFVAAALRDTAR